MAMKIGKRRIDPDSPCYVIAEAGTNHAGYRDHALRLAMDAKEAGADAVKFQAFVPNAPLFCPYKGDEVRIPYWNETALTYSAWEDVSRFCRQLGIHFILSIFQMEALPLLSLCDAAKVASRAAEKYPYSRVNMPLIISNGMGMNGVADKIAGRNHMVLECISEYPTDLSKAMTMASLVEGLSDHSGTPWPAILGIAMGHLRMVEVHFHADHSEESRDRVVELDIRQLKTICDFRDAMAA